MVSLVLSKSGKAVLVYSEKGVSVTSVKFLEMLLAGKLKGNFLVCTELGRADDRGFGGLVKGRSGSSRGVVPVKGKKDGVVLL